MRFAFLQIEGNERDYVRSKFLAMTDYGVSPDSITDALMDNALAQLHSQPPRIATADEFFDTDRRQMAQIEVSQRCARQELVTLSPLVEGEEVVEDFFSYLLEPYGDSPAYTGVLRRTTNKAQMLYIFNDVRIEQGGLVKVPAPALPKPLKSGGAPRMLGGESNSLVKELLKKVAGAVLSKAGGFVLELVSQAMFGKKDDTEQLLKEIKNTIKDEIEANEMARINGTIDGAVVFLMNEYRPLKNKLNLNNVAHREKLTTKLAEQNNKLYEVIGLLKQNKYARIGICSFQVATSLHLSITQELALVDPDFMNPNESSYLQTLHENAVKYRDHAEQVFNAAVNDRKSKITVRSSARVEPTGSGKSSSQTEYYWYDEETKESSTRWPALKNQEPKASDVADRERQLHENHMIYMLRIKMDFPELNYIPEVGKLVNFEFKESEQLQSTDV